MALAPAMSMEAAKLGLNAIVDRLDAGTAATQPYVKIFDNSAAQPADPDVTTPTGSVVLATIQLGTLAVFGNAATGTGGSAGSATAAAVVLPKTETSAPAGGTVSWFRAFNKDNDPTIDGSAGTGTVDMVLDSATISTGQQVKINTWKIKLPNGG